MALTDITISFDLAQILGGDFDVRRTKAYVTTNVESGTLMDTSTGETRLGDEAVTIESDGTGSFTTWAVGADGNPTSWQTTLVVDYPRIGQRDRQRRRFGPYTLTTADDGKNIVELEDEQAIPAEYQTAFTDQAQAYLDAQAAIAGIDDTDSAFATLVEDELVGPLTNAALAARYGTPLSASLNDAAFDALLAAADPGARFFIPEGVTVSLGAAHTLTKPVTIDGPGRILDTRVAPTTAPFTIGPAASGTRIFCPIDGSVTGSYIEGHNAIYIVGTDNGAGNAATPVTDIIIDTPRISGFGRFAVRGAWVADSSITIGDAGDLGHGGVVIQSAEDVSAHIRRLHDVGPGIGGQTYGIDFDRKDSATDLVRYPRSTNCHGRIDVTHDCPGIFLLGTHGGHHLNFEFGSAYGIARAINIGPGELDNGDDHYAPSNITWRGGYADSGVTDGSGDSAVVVAGGYNTGTSSVVEYADGISGHIDVIKGFGDEADAIGGAFYTRTTRGMSLSFGVIQEPSPRAGNLYHTNKDFSVTIGTVIDAWSNTLSDADLIACTGTDNTGVITTLRGVRGAKTATKVNTRGVVATSSTNKIKLGAATDMTACTTKVSGYVSGLTVWSAVASQMAWVLDGTVQALWYSDGLLMTNAYKLIAGASTTTRASLQIQAGTAPSAPSSGDVWSTSQGVFIRLAGATRQMFSGFTGTATLDFASIAAGAEAELTITVTGAAVGDVVMAGPPAALEAGLVVAAAYVSAADTVKIRLRNPTGSAIDPASATWRATVLRAA